MKKIGVGMIGYGGFGEFLAEAFLSMPQLKITAICDVSSGQRQLAEQRLGVRTYSEGYELIMYQYAAIYPCRLLCCRGQQQKAYFLRKTNGYFAGRG